MIEVPGAVAVCFDAPVVELLERRAEPLHAPLAGLGPDLLGAEFDAAAARRRLRDPARAATTIGEVLLDQRVMAGVGNVYRSEVLWIDRVSPFALVGAVDDETLDRLIATARRLLLANVADVTVGTRRSGPERVTAAGDRGAPGPLYAYRRTGRPCRSCGAPIASATLGRELPRSVYWCPACQGARP